MDVRIQAPPKEAMIFFFIVVVILVFYWQRDFVNKNEGLVMASVTTILVGTTIYYSLLNKRLLDATDLPKIILDIRPWNTKKQQYVFVIENVGTGIASDIKLEMLSNQPLMLNSELDLIVACAEIKPIPPKQDYKLLIETEEWEPKERKASFDIEVSYTNSQRTKLPPEKFSLSIEASHHYLQGDLVAERLGEIADHIKEIADPSSERKEIANQSPDPENKGGSAPTPEDQKKIADLNRKKMREQSKLAPSDKES